MQPQIVREDSGSGVGSPEGNDILLEEETSELPKSIPGRRDGLGKYGQAPNGDRKYLQRWSHPRDMGHTGTRELGQKRSTVSFGDHRCRCFAES